MMGKSRGPHILVCVDNHQLFVAAPLPSPVRCTEDSGYGNGHPSLPTGNDTEVTRNFLAASKYTHKLMQGKDWIKEEQGSIICSYHRDTLNVEKDIVAAWIPPSPVQNEKLIHPILTPVLNYVHKLEDARIKWNLALSQYEKETLGQFLALCKCTEKPEWGPTWYSDWSVRLRLGWAKLKFLLSHKAYWVISNQGHSQGWAPPPH